MKMDGQCWWPVRVTCPSSAWQTNYTGLPWCDTSMQTLPALEWAPTNMRLSASCRRPLVWLRRLTHSSSSTRSHWLTPGCLLLSKWPQLNDPKVFLQKANFAAFLTPGSSRTWSPTRHSQLVRACSRVDYSSILPATHFSTFFFLKTAPLRKLISSSSPKPGPQFWGKDEKTAQKAEGHRKVMRGRGAECRHLRPPLCAEHPPPRGLLPLCCA